MKNAFTTVMAALIAMLALFESSVGADARLFDAIRANDIGAVKALLASGVSPNASDDAGVTPLMYSAAFSSIEVMRLLLDAGAEVDSVNKTGATALMWAAADSTKVSLPLMMAAAGDVPNPAVVRLLIEKGAKLDERDENGMTALDWAVTQGDTPIARMLRDAGAPAPAATAPAPLPVSKPRAPRDAVAAALSRLQPASPAFSQGSRCISCHHQSLPALAVTLARARAVPVDKTLATHPDEATLQVWGPRAERSQLGDGLLAIPVSDIAYGLWQFAEEGVQPSRVIDSVVVGLAHAQRADGTWRMPDVRPPLSDSSPIHVTALAIRGLKHYAPPALRQMIDLRVVRAVQYLHSATPKDTQDEAFKLLGLVWSGASSQREISEQARRIRDLQRPSGGWGQLPAMAPDAYATGQALYALAAGGASASAAYRKGVQYLLTTQLEDGTWFVRSRAFGFQPYFDAGFPHGRNQFISTAATAWAAMALTNAVRR